MVAVGAERQSDINFIPELYALTCADSKTSLVRQNYFEKHLYYTQLISHYEYGEKNPIAAERIMRKMMAEIDGYIYEPKEHTVAVPIIEPPVIRSLVEEKYVPGILDNLGFLAEFLDLEVMWDRFDNHFDRRAYNRLLAFAPLGAVRRRVLSRNQIRGCSVEMPLGAISGILVLLRKSGDNPSLVSDLKDIHKEVLFATTGSRRERVKRPLSEYFCGSPTVDYYDNLSNPAKLGVVRTDEDAILEALNLISPNPRMYLLKTIT